MALSYKTLNGGTQVTTLNSERVMLTDANGNQLYINKADLAASITPYVSAAKDDAWIVYLDSSNNRILVPWTEWDSSRTDAVGVAIMEGGRRLIIAPDESNLYWGSVSGVGGAITTTSKDVADQDYAGKSNTAAIIASSSFTGDGAGYAPGYCNFYAKGALGAGAWWMPSLGELGMIYSKYNAINAALAKIGGTSLTRSNYWSSTELSSASAWGLYFSSGSRWYGSKATGQFHGRPVTAF